MAGLYHCTAMTCAQIAIIPMNKASDAKVAASSTTARIMTLPLGLNVSGTMFPLCSESQAKNAPSGARSLALLDGSILSGTKFPIPHCAYVKSVEDGEV